MYMYPKRIRLPRYVSIFCCIIDISVSVRVIIRIIPIFKHFCSLFVFFMFGDIVSTMKASKRQVNLDSTKNASEKNEGLAAAGGIQSFFKSVPKSFAVDKNNQTKPDDGSKKFYVDALKEKIRRKKGSKFLFKKC